MYKVCTQCGKSKPKSKFYNKTGVKCGKTAACKVCTNIKVKEYQDLNAAKVAARTLKYRRNNKAKFKDISLRFHYGIGLEKYTEMALQQNGKCAICNLVPIGKSKINNILCVDHDHRTGAVRSLLCNACNNGLARFNDNIDTMKSAIEYIKNHRSLMLNTLAGDDEPS